LVGGSGLRAVADLWRIFVEIGTCASLRFDTSRLARWDSALVAFVRALQTTADGGRRFELDLSGLPGPAQRLLSLAAADHGAGAAVEASARDSIAWHAVPGRWAGGPRS
jgi:hypothetical protein